jgi:putative ABC transport system permease protein
MIKLSDVQTGWRQLAADPVYSAIVVLGLAVAVACSYLIMGLVGDAMFPESKIARPDRVVALDFKPNIPDRKIDWTGGAPFVLREALHGAKAPIVQSARALKTDISAQAGQQVAKVDMVFADAEVAAMFGLRSEAGDLAAALSRPDSVALTVPAAERLFGRRDVLGRQITVAGKTVTVAAVLPRQGGNSQLQFEALAPFNSVINTLGQEEREGWFALAGRVYATLAPGASAEQVGTIAQSLFDHSPVIKEVPPGWIANGRKVAFLRAMPMDQLAWQGAGSGAKRLLYGALAAAALAMLALASVNYVNLTTVRTLARQREIGVRKSLGASPSRLAGQLIGESMVVAMLAGAVGVLLAYLLAPGFGELLNYRFDNRLFTPGMLLGLVAGCVLLGVVTGLYPARIALKIRCAESLAGRNHSENAGGRWVRRAMTALQFGAAITLSAVAVVIMWQSHFVRNLDLGFRTAGLLAVTLPATATPQSALALREAMLREPGVTGAAWSDDVPGRNPAGQNDAFTTGSNPNPVLIRMNAVDAAFFKVYDIALLAGQITPAAAAADGAAAAGDKSVVLDRTGATQLGFANVQDAVGASLKGSDGKFVRVVAVIERVRQETAHAQSGAQLFFMNDGQFGPGAVLTVQAGDMAAARKSLQGAWARQFPQEVPVLDTVSAYLAEHYKQDRMVGGLIAAASLMALLLAGLGVYSLAAYTVRIKTREIVLRKLYGAGSGAIAAVLAREFGALLAMGLVIGLPLAWLASSHYLGGYVERAPTGAWPLLAAVLVTAVMAALAALRHTLAAVALRPVMALRG